MNEITGSGIHPQIGEGKSSSKGCQPLGPCSSEFIVAVLITGATHTRKKLQRLVVVLPCYPYLRIPQVVQDVLQLA